MPHPHSARRPRGPATAKVAATPRLPVTPAQLVAGAASGAVGLQALFHRLSPPRREPGDTLAIDGPLEDSMTIKRAAGEGLFDARTFNGDVFAAPGPELPPEIPPRPPLVGPPRPSPVASAPAPPGAGPYSAGPGDFEPPQGLLSRMRGFYDESVAPRIGQAAQWANDNPLPAAGLLGLGGLGAYGAYRAMQPDEEDEGDGPVKMGSDVRLDDLSPEARDALSRVAAGIGGVAGSVPITGALLGAANAPRGYLGQGLARGFAQGAGTVGGAGAGGLLGLLAASNSGRGGDDVLGAVGGGLLGGLGGYHAAGALMGEAPWDRDRDVARD